MKLEDLIDPELKRRIVLSELNELKVEADESEKEKEK